MSNWESFDGADAAWKTQKGTDLLRMENVFRQK